MYVCMYVCIYMHIGIVRTEYLTLFAGVHSTLTNWSWWRHQMETFSALLAICAGNSPVPVNSPHKCQWRGALMLSLICVWINGWVNNHDAGDLRRYRVHYDVIVMVSMLFWENNVNTIHSQCVAHCMAIFRRVVYVLVKRLFSNP